MKHKLIVNTEDRLFTIITEGDGDVEGIKKFLIDITSHPEWKLGYNILLDHRKLKIDQITVDGIQHVSSYVKSISSKLGNGKMALVMKREIDFGITRAWEITTEAEVDIKICVFREIERAIAWLKQ